MRGRWLRDASSLSDDLPRFCKPHSCDGDVELQKLRCVVPGCDGPAATAHARTDGVALYCMDHRG